MLVMLAEDPYSPNALMGTFRMVMATLRTKLVVFNTLFFGSVCALEVFPFICMCRASWQNILATYTWTMCTLGLKS